MFRATGLYIIAAWGLLQVLDLAFSSWEYPPVALKFVWIGALLCFPVALIFGWRYDLTIDGVVRTPPSDPDEDIDLSLRGFDYMLLAGMSVITAVVATSIIHQILNVDPELEEPDVVRSMAVLPFANSSAAEGMDFFSDGLTEEIIGLLADLEEIRVAASSSSFRYKDRDYSIKEVAESLSVDALLQGSVRRHEDDLRITAQLVDPASESILWTETYSRRVEDVFEIEADIARQVADTLEIVLSDRSNNRLRKAWTTTPEAYDAYLMGREYLRRPKSGTTFEAAVGRFERAIELDGDFAPAQAGLCEARLGQYELTREAAFFGQAEAACLRAVTRDSESTTTYLALAYLHFFAGQYDKAEEEFDHVIRNNKSLVDAYLGLARTYAAQERPDRAEATFDKAIRLDDHYWDGYQLRGNFLFAEGRYGEAAQNYRKVIALTPDNAHAHSNLGAAYYMAGDFEGAARAYRESLAQSPTRAGYSNTGTMYYFSGDFSSAAQMYREALKITPDDGRMWGNLADALWAGAGSRSQAADAYRRASELMREQLSISPDDADAEARLAYFSARLGDNARAKELIASSLENDPDAVYTHYYAALIYEASGDDAQALASLGNALDLGYHETLVLADPALARLPLENLIETR